MIAVSGDLSVDMCQEIVTRVLHSEDGLDPAGVLMLRSINHLWLRNVATALRSGEVRLRVPSILQLAGILPSNGIQISHNGDEILLDGDVLRAVGSLHSKIGNFFSFGDPDYVTQPSKAVNRYGQPIPNGYSVHVKSDHEARGTPDFDLYGSTIHGMRALWRHVQFHVHRMKVLVKVALIAQLNASPSACPALSASPSAFVVSKVITFLRSVLDRQVAPSSRLKINKGFLALLDAWQTLRFGFAFEVTGCLLASKGRKSDVDVCNDVGSGFISFDPWGDLVQSVVESVDAYLLQKYSLKNFARLRDLYWVQSPAATIVILGDDTRERHSFARRRDGAALEARREHHQYSGAYNFAVQNLEVCVDVRQSASPNFTFQVTATPLWIRGDFFIETPGFWQEATQPIRIPLMD